MFGGMTVNDSDLDHAELLGPPQKFEAGLQNYSGIFGAGAAVDYLLRVGFDEIREHEISLIRRLREKIEDLDGLRIISHNDPAVSGGIFSFNIRNIEPHDVAVSLDAEYGIMIRSGYHCCHSWFHSRGISGCGRASVYLYNDERDIDIFATALERLSQETS
jgi:cysteine desulfurase/selenocysteine lyase